MDILYARDILELPAVIHCKCTWQKLRKLLNLMITCCPSLETGSNKHAVTVLFLLNVCSLALYILASDVENA